ncbi:hypothetical protein ACLUTX_04960 [Enterobacterales bacterium AE_CKDN230030158-1A_HGKHYDSX7]
MIPRRSIEELLVRHQFEPGLKDVYVEGVFDKEVLTSCFQANSRSDYIVYEVDGIEVPGDVLRKYGLTDGNKQRVIALAKELSTLEGDKSYRCIVDKDLDSWLNAVENVPRLKWTEHASLELYFYTRRIVSDLLVSSGRARIADLDAFMDSLVLALKKIFAMRLADKNLDWKMEWVDPYKDLSISGSGLLLDYVAYSARILSKNKHMAERTTFDAETIKWEAMLVGDPRSYIRGHDLVDLMAWSIKEFKGIKEVANSVTIERMLVLLSAAVSELLELIE